MEIKTRIITEEKRNTQVTDCNELDGKEDVTKIEYISEEIAATEIIDIENPKYALITYRKYIFEVDDELKIIDVINSEDNNNPNILNNNSILGKVSKINTSGVQNITVNGVTYSANIIVENNDLVLDGEKEVQGATLNNKVYEFGNNLQDVAKQNEDGTVENAQNMVILKVNGNLSINENVTLTACKSEQGYGGPKGLLIYCTGTLTNNGKIAMTARGARTEGQDVHLWRNKNGKYETVPAEGANGADELRSTAGSGSGIYKNGNDGVSALEDTRKTGGGGSGAVGSGTSHYKTQIGGAGSKGTSYSGGTGGGAAYVGSSAVDPSDSKPGEINGGKGGNAITGNAYFSGGGAGNPGGTGNNYDDSKKNVKGSDGTGGLLIIYSEAFENLGSIESNGSAGGYGYAYGGSSGGGSINIFYKNLLNKGNIFANGGSNGNGGKGGSGSITIGNIASGTFVKDE